VIKSREITGIRNVSSLCIRVARDFPGIAGELANLKGSILILGAPGWGKTTLLRDLIRQKDECGCHISVLDEREELFPDIRSRGTRTEVLSGCPKEEGMDILLRTMAPEIIALDEITAAEDCDALSRAAWCGVSLLATAHAASLSDFLHREIYAPLVRQAIFDHIIILRSDKSWFLERSKGWTTNGSVRY
jgi:stage III sporulation protein AA